MHFAKKEQQLFFDMTYRRSSSSNLALLLY